MGKKEIELFTQEFRKSLVNISSNNVPNQGKAEKNDR